MRCSICGRGAKVTFGDDDADVDAEAVGKACGGAELERGMLGHGLGALREAAEVGGEVERGGVEDAETVLDACGGMEDVIVSGQVCPLFSLTDFLSLSSHTRLTHASLDQICTHHALVWDR